MNIEQVRKEIEKKLGVPAELLTGSTIEENVKQAVDILDYKSQFETPEKKSPAKQFSEWIETPEKTETEKSIDDNINGNGGQTSENENAGAAESDLSEQFTKHLKENTNLSLFPELKNLTNWYD